MNKQFTFTLKTDVKFGVGIARQINKFLPEDLRQIGLIIDKGVIKTEPVKDLIENLHSSIEVVKIFENTIAEPDYDYLDYSKEEFSGVDLDGLIGIGGGSTLDLTKGIAALLKNPGKAITYRGFDLVKNPSLPIVAIPTTAGTGSEVTPFASFIDKKGKIKLGINTKYNIPRLAILDPELTLTCPASVTISSGMDALLHAIESYVSKNATPISRIFSQEAFALIFNNLHKVVNALDDVELRSKLLLGSYLAGVAIMNSGAGPAAALSYPLGVHFNVPHGLAGAVFLPRVVRLNVEKGFEGYAPLYDLVENASKNLNKVHKNLNFCELLEELCDKLSIPKTLTSFNVTRRNRDIIINEIFGNLLKGGLEQNPVKLNKNDIRKLLQKMT